MDHVQETALWKAIGEVEGTAQALREDLDSLAASAGVARPGRGERMFMAAAGGVWSLIYMLVAVWSITAAADYFFLERLSPPPRAACQLSALGAK